MTDYSLIVNFTALEHECELIANDVGLLTSDLYGNKVRFDTQKFLSRAVKVNMHLYPVVAIKPGWKRLGYGGVIIHHHSGQSI